MRRVLDRMRGPACVAVLAAASVNACDRGSGDPAPQRSDDAGPSSAADPSSAAAPSRAPAAPAASGTEVAPAIPPAPARTKLTLLAGGDVSYGRMVGQILLKNPEHELFSTLAPWIRSADVSFCNLESPLSDQKGETQSPHNNLVFNGPPSGADSLARAGFTVVSTANNHAWDYGKSALFETMDNLERAGVLYVGTGRDRAAAYRPLILERDGFRLGIFAVTHIWNQGQLSSHEGAEYVAAPAAPNQPDVLAHAVRALRAEGRVDAIAVSYHGGAEYIPDPLPRTIEVLRGAIDAGADIVIGHHPHVIQGVEWRGDRPILYSLGNLLFRMHSKYPRTGMGYMARIVFTRGAAPTVEACPYRIHGIVPMPFAGDPDRASYESQFFSHLATISKTVGGTTIGPSGADGCAALTPPSPKVPSAPSSKIPSAPSTTRPPQPGATGSSPVPP